MMVSKYHVLFFFLISLLALSACKSAEFSCEDNGGLWYDEYCLEATTDSGYFCSDTSECDGYCYTTKHPKAIATAQANNAPLAGTCSEYIEPLNCATILQSGEVVELCRN